MSEKQTVQFTLAAIVCALPWLFVLWTTLSHRHNMRELSDIEARLNRIRERLNLPK